jgi:hypothetical protein
MLMLVLLPMLLQVTVAERAAVEPPRLGKHRFEAAPVAVLTSDEVTGSLRQIKVRDLALNDSGSMRFLYRSGIPLSHHHTCCYMLEPKPYQLCLPGSMHDTPVLQTSPAWWYCGLSIPRGGLQCWRVMHTIRQAKLGTGSVTAFEATSMCRQIQMPAATYSWSPFGRLLKAAGLLYLGTLALVPNATAHSMSLSSLLSLMQSNWLHRQKL